MDAFPDQLRCPICYEVPESAIFLCSNGHTICDKCSSTCELCPHCRVSYKDGKIRNRQMEELLDSYKVDCPHKEKGCRERVFRETLLNHVANCVHNGKKISFCGQLGYTCGHSISLEDIPKAIEHFKKSHGVMVRRSSKVAVQVESFRTHVTMARRKSQQQQQQQQSQEDSAKWMWTPVILSLEDAAFLILTLFDGGTQMIAWMCIVIGGGSGEATDEEINKYQVTFLIKGQGQSQDMTWKVGTVGIKTSNDYLQTPPFQIPVGLLLNHNLSEDGSIQVQVSITRSPSNIVASSSDTNLEPIWIFKMPPKSEQARPPTLKIASSSSQLVATRNKNDTSVLPSQFPESQTKTKNDENTLTLLSPESEPPTPPPRTNRSQDALTASLTKKC